MWIFFVLSKDYETNSSSHDLLGENIIVQTNRWQHGFLMGERKKVGRELRANRGNKSQTLVNRN